MKFATKIQSVVEMMLERLLYVIAKSSCVDMNNAIDIFVATSAVQHC